MSHVVDIFNQQHTFFGVQEIDVEGGRLKTIHSEGTIVFAADKWVSFTILKGA